MDKVIDKTPVIHFTIIDNYILNSADLVALEQILYIHLKQYAIKSNKCFTAINTLAKSLRLSENTVRKTIKSLKSKGYIDIQQRFNSSNEYTLLVYPEYSKELEKLSVHEDKPQGIGKVLLAYQNNINPTYGSMEREKLKEWFDTFENNEDILVKAIEVATTQGVRNLKYLERVLLSWQENGVKDLQQCEAFIKAWERKRSEKGNGVIVKNSETGTKEKYDFTKYGDV